MMQNAVDIKNLSHYYGSYSVLKEISFSIPKGRFFIIIGPNGSGKTTLLKSISGIEKARNEKLDILGKPITEYSRRALARTIALVPQMVTIDFPFTVMELVLMGRSPYLGILGLEEEKDPEIAREAISFTGVEHLSDRKLDQLSGGERQRVFIARAICQQPSVILLDEPTASLDIAHQIKVMDLMEKLKEDKGVTVVMVSHEINLAAMYSDELLLLKDGEIVGMGLPEDVLSFEILENVYGCKLLIDESPLGKFKRITPVPGKFLDK